MAKLIKKYEIGKGKTVEIKEVNRVLHAYIVEDLEIEKNNFYERLKTLCAIRNIDLPELAKRIEFNYPKFYNGCQFGRFRFSDQKKIAEALGCSVVNKFVFNDGTEYESDTIKDIVVDMCVYVGVSQMEIAKRMHKSRQTLYSKLSHETFSCVELEELAEALGCKYISYFELEDGTRI